VGDLSDELLGEINKRLTLNMLIQGVACHTLLTAHHLVADELEAVQPGLVEQYDRLTVSLFLNYWIGDLALTLGRPRRFWKRTGRKSHPFHRHRLLAMHGGELSESFRQHLVQRAKVKGVRRVPGLHTIEQVRMVFRTMSLEADAKSTLEAVACEAAALIWSIDAERLDGELTTLVEFGNIRTPATWKGRVLRMGAVGWGGVEQREGRMVVVAKAQIWPLLVHELVKGTAELICLHGLNHLEDGLYQQVLEATDHIEYESWQMQTGVELWRRLLPLLPAHDCLAQITMRIARLEPEPVEELMLAVVTQPSKARAILARL
jgi:hypothetical protein